ncbi:MAG: hypothetical protein GY940_44570 [bacterium]|nr:hypothetical protein [bacterium]
MDRKKKIKQLESKFGERIKNLYWKQDSHWHNEFREYADEIFRQIPLYMGFYFVSNYGRLISFMETKPRRMEPEFRDNALRVVLNLDGEAEEYTIAVLVYKCFGGPMRQGVEVENINGNPRDNRFVNLRLPGTKKNAVPPPFPLPMSSNGSPVEVPPPAVEKRSKKKAVSKKKKIVAKGEKTVTRSKRKQPPPRPGLEVLQFDMRGNYLKKYASPTVVCDTLGLDYGQLRNSLRNRSRSTGGFQWFYLKDPLFKDGIRNLPSVTTRELEILQFSLEGKFIRSFKSVTEAGKVDGFYEEGIRDNVKGRINQVYGYQFRYRHDPEFTFGIRDIPPVEPIIKRPYNARCVVQFDLNGKFIAEYDTIADAARSAGAANASNIKGCLERRYHYASGFLWRYREDPRFSEGITDIEPLDRTKGNYAGPILQFGLDGKFIAQYSNSRKAGEAVGVSYNCILLCAQGKLRISRKFQWRFLVDPLFRDGIVDIAPLNYKKIPSNAMKVLKYNRTGKLVATYDSISEAARENNVSSTLMRKYLDEKIDENAEFSFELES